MAQVILLAAGLLVAKFYGPAPLGVFAAYSALTFALVPLASLRYSQAIPLVRRREDADRILALCGVLSMTIPVLGVVMAIPFVTAGMVSTGWVTAVATGTALLSLQQSAQLHLTAIGAFDRFATSRVVYAAVLLAFQTLFVLVSKTGAVLIVAEFLATCVAVSWAFQRIRPASIRAQLNRRNLAQIARAYADLPRYQLLGGLINAVALQAPVFLIGISFGSAAAGLYALAYRLLYAPIGLISQSVGAVFLPTVAKEARTQMPSRVLQTAGRLTLFSGLYATFLGVLAPLVIPRALGDRWSDSVQVIWLLAPMVVVYAATSAVSTVLLVVRRLRLLLIIQFMLLVTTVVPFCSPLFSDLSLFTTLAIYSALQIAAYIFYFACVLRVARDAASR